MERNEYDNEIARFEAALLLLTEEFIQARGRNKDVIGRYMDALRLQVKFLNKIKNQQFQLN
jgi:hypothetical protein